MILTLGIAAAALGLAAACIWAAISDQLDDFDASLYDF